MTNEINTIDDLMSRDPLELTATDIDGIIAYHRKARANAAAGIKPKRESGPKVDIGEALSGFLAQPKASVPTIRRR